MRDDPIGYGKRPRHSQFKKGICPNPCGQGRRGGAQFDKITDRVLNAKVQYEERGKRKKTSRKELLVRMLFDEALEGNVASAELLLTLCAEAAAHGDTGTIVIRIVGGFTSSDLAPNDKSGS